MKITENMNLDQLAERMGNEATEAQASHMRDTLNGLGRWSSTEDVPENEWLSLCEASAAQAKYD